MKCPYCGSELIYEDEYYVGIPGRYVNGCSPYPIGYYSEPSSNYKVLGEIYRCSNSTGFEDEFDGIEYAKNNGIEFTNPSEIVCESNCHRVCGSFYTENGELKEGYPC
jgi:hypothetical protein